MMVEAYEQEAAAANGEQQTASKRGERPQPNDVVMQKLRQQSNFSIIKPGPKH